MAKLNMPTIPDDKITYFREQLFRELSTMFEWHNLPPTVPVEYIERTLVRKGRLLFYEDSDIGLDVLHCEVMGYNRHNYPTQARSFTPNTVGTSTLIERTIKRQTDSKQAVELFNPQTDGVLINNMAHGQSSFEIVDFFAKRLALVQQSIDTSVFWTNLPYIFLTSNDDTMLSIKKMFASVFKGEPLIISDKELFADNENRAGVPTNIQFNGKELMDMKNEIMMDFRQTVGFDTAGVDKAERTNTLEIMSNEQHTKSVVEIMLEQRKLACDDINAFFGTNLSVTLLHDPIEENKEEGGEELGTSDGGITPPAAN